MKIKKFFIALLLAAIFVAGIGCKEQTMKEYEKTLMTGNVGAHGHVQGIATDGEYFYSSITSILVKQDASGKVVGSVTGFGDLDRCHLGDMTYNPDDGMLYASLYVSLNGPMFSAKERAGGAHDKNCYLVIVDPNVITETEMQANDVCKVVNVTKPIAEYAEQNAGFDLWLGGKYAIRYGVDSCTFGPKFGSKSKNGKKYLTMTCSTATYSVDIDGVTPYDREDADYFTIFQYDVTEWSKYAKPFGEIANAVGPEKPDGTYFYYAGFHDYGVQNLCYDEYKNVYFVTTYYTDYHEPSRSKFPNYTFFVIDPSYVKEQTLTGCGGDKGLVLRSKYGKKHDSGVMGYELSASVGILSLGDGRYYVANVLKGGAAMTLYEWSDDTSECCIKEVE